MTDGSLTFIVALDWLSLLERLVSRAELPQKDFVLWTLIGSYSSEIILNMKNTEVIIRPYSVRFWHPRY